MKPLGGMMLAVARVVRDGKVVNYEFTRLEIRAARSFMLLSRRRIKTRRRSNS